MSLRFSIRPLTLIISLVGLTLSNQFQQAVAQEVADHKVVPFTRIPSEQWIEVVSGDPGAAGVPFVLRLHNDAGFVVLPHTHPEDEHIAVIQGTWSVAMGSRLDRSVLRSVEVGDYTLVPRRMAHFGWAKTEVTIQVHGVGPFSIDFVDPMYELTEGGVALASGIGQPENAPPLPDRSCFRLKIADNVSGVLGIGNVVGGQCSPANEFTQYWIQREDGERFWAIFEDLTKL